MHLQLSKMETKTVFQYKEKDQVHLPQELTLKEIAPIWAARLGTERKPPLVMSLTWLIWQRELRHPSGYVVGEAYHNSSMYLYDCHKCNSLGYKFMLYFTLNWHKKLEQNKQEFVKHWNEKHKPTQ
jgi:hypothetical protein